MRTSHILFFFFALISLSFTQDDLEDEIDEEMPSEYPDPQEYPQEGNPQEQQEYAHSEKDLKEVLDSYGAEQQARVNAFKKITARLLDVCYGNMPVEKAQKLLNELRQNNFEIKNYFDTYQSFQWETYVLNTQNPTDLKLTPQEEQLLNFKEEFEKAMKERNQKQEEEDEFQKINPEDTEPKIAGLSMKNAPKSLQFAYLIGILAIAGGILVYGLQYLQRDHKLPGDKKSKKKKKQ